MYKLLWALAGASLAVSGFSAADAVQPRALQVAAGKPYKHKPSGAKVADQAAGLHRTEVMSFDPAELNVAIVFANSDRQELTTVYLFRNVTGSVPVWFDRARTVIKQNAGYGQVQAMTPPVTFTPAGMATNTGLLSSYTVSKKAKSTAVALAQAGEWYVKVRTTSATLDAPALQQRLIASFSAIEWPRNLAPAAVASPVAPCASALPSQSAAKPVADAGPLNLINAVSGFAATDRGRKRSSAVPVTYCRDNTAVEFAAVYRPIGTNNRYLLAIGDYGHGVIVAPDAMAGLFNPGQHGTVYTAELHEVGRKLGLGSFSSLPPVSQVASLASSGRYAYSAPTWGKDKTIELSTDGTK